SDCETLLAEEKQPNAVGVSAGQGVTGARAIDPPVMMVPGGTPLVEVTAGEESKMPTSETKKYGREKKDKPSERLSRNSLLQSPTTP
ncbi:hypothetical protein FRC11_014135, partial [Ceratobasidium sp. 423]